MKFTRKALALSIMAVTASMSAQAVQISSDNMGQLLLGPVYAAGAGQSTTLRVVNPSNEIAVKAHVAFRSATSSLDLLNFTVYLSPGDEWIGTLEHGTDATGLVTPVLKSSDDSLLYAVTPANAMPTTGLFTSAANPKALPLYPQRTKSNPPVTNEKHLIGHFEILGVYAVSNQTGTAATGTTNSVITAGMSKEILFDIDNVVYGSTAGTVASGAAAAGTAASFVANNVAKGGLYDGYIPVNNPRNFATAACGGVTAVDTFAVTANVNSVNDTVTTAGTVPVLENYCISTTDDRIQLYGDVTVKLNQNSAPFSYQMIALNDSNGQGVIDNPYFDIVAENDVPLGVNMGYAIGADGIRHTADDMAIDNINNIEMALASDKYIGAYESLTANGDLEPNPAEGVAESLLLVTFPTKYRHVPALDNANLSFGIGIGVCSPQIKGVAASCTNPAGTTTVTDGLIDVLVDNQLSAGIRVERSVDYDESFVHYDYGYGLQTAYWTGLDAFDAAVTASDNRYITPNHEKAFGSYIIGTDNDACAGSTASLKPFVGTTAGAGLRMPINYRVVSFDTQENFAQIQVSSEAGVISGGPGGGTAPNPNSQLPDEVNILTDAQLGWYSTSGWYEFIVRDTVNPASPGTTLGSRGQTAVAIPNQCDPDTTVPGNEYSVPAIVMTVTTDKNGNSRAVPASRWDGR